MNKYGGYFGIFYRQKLCSVLEKINETKKRLEIQSYLKDYFLELCNNKDSSYLIAACYLCTGSFYPEHYGKELGIGETSIVKMVTEITGKKVKQIRDEMRQTGDLGTIAMKNKIKPLPFFKKKHEDVLTINKVLLLLREISDVTGSDSSKYKLNKMLKAITQSKGLEIKYLVRLFEGKMKIGLALKTVLISLAQALTLKNNKSNLFMEEKEIVHNIKFAYNQCPVFEIIIEALLKYGPVDISSHIQIKPGIPVKPMLAQPSKNLTAAYKRVEGQKFTCEYKYDGERAQIHKINENDYKVFSRNSEDLTQKYPELNETLLKISKTGFNYILDCEVVAYCAKENKILPFQILTTRKRKDVKISEIKVDVCLFCFDLLFFNDNSMLEKSFSDRRNLLFGNFDEIQNKFIFAQKKDCNSVEEIDNIFNESINVGCEGLMIKNLDSLYKPSMRSTNWIKLKKDYLEGMSDTIDLTVIGAYFGKGKRTGVYGGFLLACYDDENDKYEAICKIGTGFDDFILFKIFNEMKEFVIADDSNKSNIPKNYVINDGVKPDIWVLPKFVWEVKAAGFSLSPIYSAAALFNSNNGISLRFPRFIRERNDKSTTDSTTSEQINLLFNEFKNENIESDEFN